MAGDWLTAIRPRTALPGLMWRLSPSERLRGPKERILADYPPSLARNLPEAATANLPAVLKATRVVIASCCISVGAHAAED